MEYAQLLESRRSIRNYKKDISITVDQIKVLIDAAQQAPSWKNTETGRYYVALSKEAIENVKAKCLPDFNANRCENVAALIITTYETKKSGYNNDGTATNELGDKWGAYDLGLQNENLILKAREIGYDTLIMGIRDADQIRAIFSIPESQDIAAVIAVGVREDDVKKPVRKDMDEILKIF